MSRKQRAAKRLQLCPWCLEHCSRGPGPAGIRKGQCTQQNQPSHLEDWSLGRQEEPNSREWGLGVEYTKNGTLRSSPCQTVLRLRAEACKVGCSGPRRSFEMLVSFVMGLQESCLAFCCSVLNGCRILVEALQAVAVPLPIC